MENQDNVEKLKLEKIIEALMFIQGEMGLSSSDLKDVLSIPINDARKYLKDFMLTYNANDGALEVFEYNDNFTFLTREKYKAPIMKLVAIEKKQRLSTSALEVIGIVAYNQPITRSKINEIRGTDSNHIVQSLLVKGLIEERGVMQTPGNPFMYGVTDKFYNYFKIKSLKDLPKFSEIKQTETTEESFDLFTSQREE